MKSKEEIAANWLPRYTGTSINSFGKYILLTNFLNYVETFADKFDVEVKGRKSPMQTATLNDITIINFGPCLLFPSSFFGSPHLYPLMSPKPAFGQKPWRPLWGVTSRDQDLVSHLASQTLTLVSHVFHRGALRIDSFGSKKHETNPLLLEMKRGLLIKTPISDDNRALRFATQKMRRDKRLLKAGETNEKPKLCSVQLCRLCKSRSE